MLNRLLRLLRSDQDLGRVDQALIIALVVVAVIGIVLLLGSAIESIFSTIKHAL